MRKKQKNNNTTTYDKNYSFDKNYDRGNEAGLGQRLSRLEKKLSSNEQVANLMVDALISQTLASEAVRDIIRRSLREDAIVHDELVLAIKSYDKAKFRRAFSGLLGVLLWMVSVGVAAVIGAFIHWTFSGGADML